MTSTVVSHQNAIRLSEGPWRPWLSTLERLTGQAFRLIYTGSNGYQVVSASVEDVDDLNDLYVVTHDGDSAVHLDPMGGKAWTVGLYTREQHESGSGGIVVTADGISLAALSAALFIAQCNADEDMPGKGAEEFISVQHFGEAGSAKRRLEAAEDAVTSARETLDAAREERRQALLEETRNGR